MKKNTWAVVFSFCLIAFTVFIALDTFVLSSVYQADATQINTEMIVAAKENGESAQKESESPQTDDTDDSGKNGDKNGDGNPAGGGASPPGGRFDKCGWLPCCARLSGASGPASLLCGGASGHAGSFWFFVYRF